MFVKKYKSKNYVELKENLFKNRYCQVEFNKDKAMLKGHGDHVFTFNMAGRGISEKVGFYTIGSQSTTEEYVKQFAELTDCELVENTWNKLHEYFTDETDFLMLIKFIENEGVKVHWYNEIMG